MNTETLPILLAIAVGLFVGSLIKGQQTHCVVVQLPPPPRPPAPPPPDDTVTIIMLMIVILLEYSYSTQIATIIVTFRNLFIQ